MHLGMFTFDDKATFDKNGKLDLFAIPDGATRPILAWSFFGREDLRKMRFQTKSLFCMTEIWWRWKKDSNPARRLAGGIKVILITFDNLIEEVLQKIEGKVEGSKKIHN